MSETTKFNDFQLAISGLGVVRGGRLVFENFNLKVSAGELIVLRGPNGSGKSTLIRTLAGLLPPSSGEISQGGVSAADDPEACRTKIALSGHQNGMKPALTLRQNLAHYAVVVLGVRADDDALEAAATALNLGDLLDDEIRYYSAGQLHRAGLAKLALSDCPLWLMDEPTVGLDAENRASLVALIKSHLSAGGIVIAATHEDLGVEGSSIEMSDYTPTSQPTSIWLDEEVA